MDRSILHIDMNSYFATVEQQANPYLRGKPVGVRGSANPRTIVAAASIEAKKHGVKTGMRVQEAKALCPEINFVIGEPRKYSSVTKKFIEIFERYTDQVEIFSIDEAFLDVTATQHLFGGAERVAQKIKEDIKKEIGEWITCSAGVSYNKFLAKLGSDLEKPDGLVVINRENKDQILLSCELEDFCGIASRISRRLNNLGIKTVADLRQANPMILFKEFGSYGMKVYRMGFGIDNSPVLPWRQQKDAKSFGHSRTLNKDVVDLEEIRRHIYLLSERVADRMRAEKYWGKEVFLWLRFKNFEGVGQRKKIGGFICDGYEIYKQALKILKDLPIPLPVRAIGVGVSGVLPEKFVPVSFLEEDQINERILSVLDKVNGKYGQAKLKRAIVSNMELKKIVSGMGRKKF